MDILRYTAFTTDPRGGNPAGIVLDASGATDEDMQRIAAEVGYSETAFVVARDQERLAVRYFSPKSEVDFCGHATIATAIAYGHSHGTSDSGKLVFETKAGEIGIELSEEDGDFRATLTSVPTRLEEVSSADLDEALAALGWQRDELDPALGPRVAFGGVKHLVLAASTRDRLARLDYDFDRLARLMLARRWITLQLVWRESETLFHARDPFPVGGVVEDPATGAAAAAFGGYLRDLDLLKPSANFLIRQGEDMGQASELRVELVAGDRRVKVSGRACRL